MMEVSSLKTSCYLAPDEYLTIEHGMSIDFWEQAGGRSGKTKGLMERQQRTTLAEKTSENQNRAHGNPAEDQDDELRQLINAKRQRINFPAATAEKQLEDLDRKIVLKLDSLIGDITLEHKLATFGNIVY
ncbi:reverse transcriptase [Elysia marginata]|uniref:Reverse transcriptase n=1 Tax=Elysia marginata TaxID=1093978 RepID=A0AAV4GIP1_9GAST|nr:reverse transcriptase [Elysia marginata]